MTLYLELDANPTGTAQQKGVANMNGHIHHFEKATVRRQREVYKSKILEAIADQGLEVPTYEDAVYLKVYFFFAIKDRRRWGSWKTSVPDCDNVVKLIQDALGDLGFFAKGDQQVSKLKVEKSYSERPGIFIEIGRLIQP